MILNKEFAHKPQRTTPWDKNEQRTPLQEFLSLHNHAHYNEHHPLLCETGETKLINSYIPKACLYCKSEAVKMNGHTKNGVQRYKCLECTQTLTPVTRTIFEGHKISIRH